MSLTIVAEQPMDVLAFPFGESSGLERGVAPDALEPRSNIDQLYGLPVGVAMLED